jgi:hypothetical protein
LNGFWNHSVFVAEPMFGRGLPGGKLLSCLAKKVTKEFAPASPAFGFPRHPLPRRAAQNSPRFICLPK